jgi:Spy/CpxP family protein refolding chaperone
MQRIVMLAAMLAVLALSGAAQAQYYYGPDYHSGPGVGAYGSCPVRHNELTQDQLDTFKQIIRSYEDETYDLRTDLWAKQQQLEYLYAQAGDNQDKVEKLTTEIADMRKKLFKQRRGLVDELEEKIKIGGDWSQCNFGEWFGGPGGQPYRGRGGMRMMESERRRCPNCGYRQGY